MKDTLIHDIDKLNRQFGPVAVVCMADSPNGDIVAIPTGSTALDEALSIGGVPRGRLTEIYGPPASGKTSLALSIAAQAQKRGESVAFIDTEHVLNWEYALRLGIVPERFYIAQPGTCEEALAIALGLVQSGKVSVVIIDSIAGLAPRAEVEGEIGDRHAGLQAGLIGQALRKMASPLKRSNTALVVTNQMRTRIGVLYGSRETTCGGNALRFYASVRLDIRMLQTIKYDSQVIGIEIRATVRKSKVGMPFRWAEFGLFYGVGLVDSIEGALQAMREAEENA